MTTTDTAAALEAAIVSATTDQTRTDAGGHNAIGAAMLRTAVAAHVEAEVARHTATLRRDLDEARGLRHVVCDRCGEPIQVYAPGRVGCPCIETEIARRLAATSGVEDAIDALIDAKNIDTRAAVAAERGESSTFWKTEPIVPAKAVALRTAIAADKARAVAGVISPAVHELRNALPPVRYHAARITDDARCAAILRGVDRALAVADELAAVLDNLAAATIRRTPAEARRLVEAFEQACDMWQFPIAEARTAARAALLRALILSDGTPDP
jgi:hypothetical protein